MIWILKTDCKRCVSINQSSFISSCNITKTLAFSWLYIRRVWRYQRGNPYIEEEQTTQWTNAKHTHKTKDRVTRTPLKTGGELRCSGRVSSSGSTNDIRRVNLVTNPVISCEWGKDWEVFEHIRGHLWHIYSITVNQVMVATVQFSKWWLFSTLSKTTYYKNTYSSGTPWLDVDY